MTFNMKYTGPDYNGGYRIRLTDLADTYISLTVDAKSVEKTVTDIFKDFPNDFRDMVYKCMVDYATKYFEAHPDAKGYVGFFGGAAIFGLCVVAYIIWQFGGM